MKQQSERDVIKVFKIGKRDYKAMTISSKLKV